jgi:hypothetical protein
VDTDQRSSEVAPGDDPQWEEDQHVRHVKEETGAL